ncbi:thioredoxin domain-containing protein [Rhodobacterales bacterium HKCCE2091]|nr:thioredoxin domain-containing protein [Rhodobacterales bacterium HKCCE2091]
MNRRFLLMSGAGAFAIAGGGYALLRGDSVGAQGVEVPTDTGELPEGAMGIPDMVMGDADAPVEFIEYASYTCGHCQRFHDEVLPQLRADYIDTGKVRFVFREFFLNPIDLWATMVARCADPVRYFGVAEALYENQREWIQGEAPQIADNLRRLGRSVGLSDERLEACLTDAQTAEALNARFEHYRDIHPVEGTPTFVINGTLYTNRSYAELRDIIDAAVAEAEG